MRRKSEISTIRPLTCTMICFSLLSIVPAGNSWLLPRIAVAISSTPTPKLSIFAASKLMLTWRFTPPKIFTSPTPCAVWSFGTIVLSAISVKSRKLRSGPPEITSDIIGAAFGSFCVTTGSSTSSRKFRLTVSILPRTSCKAFLMSVPNSNCATTTDTPWYEREVRVLIPLTVLSASSIGRDTSFSTEDGAAPS